MRRAFACSLLLGSCAACTKPEPAPSAAPSARAASAAPSPSATTSAPIPAVPPGSTQPPSPILELAVGEWVGAARLANGDLWYWGLVNNAPGQAWPRPRKLPPFSGSPITSLTGAVGDDALCAIRADATLSCFASPRLGSTTWQDPFPPASQLTRVVDIAVSHLDRCVVVQGGSVWCWGYNSYGELGTGTSSEGQSPTPRRVVGLDHVVHVAVGNGHACALRADGTVWCWGSDESGQLGDLPAGATPAGHLVVRPAAVPELDVVGARFRPKAAPVPGLHGVTSIAAGTLHTCALRNDKTVWCWGSGSGGALGTPPITIQSTPTAVPGVADVTQIASGGDHVCAVTASRHVMCWGREFEGTQVPEQRRELSPEPSAAPAKLAPFEVADLDDVVHVGVGTTHACALRGDGSVRCWGKNQYGELGDGSGKPQRMATVMW